VGVDHKGQTARFHFTIKKKQKKKQKKKKKNIYPFSLPLSFLAAII